MKDLKLDETTHDLEIHKFDLRTTLDIEGARQSTAIRLKMFQGEWLLDERVGIPYFDILLGKKPNIEFVNTYLVNEIVSDSQIDKMIDFKTALDRQTRNLNIEFTALTKSGENFTDTIEIGVINGRG